MDGDWALKETGPGRYMKVRDDGTSLGRATEEEVRAWQKAQESNWTLVEYRPGRYAKVALDGAVIGKAGEAEVRAWFVAQGKERQTSTSSRDPGARAPDRKGATGEAGIHAWFAAQRQERQAKTPPSDAPALSTAEETGEPDIRAWLAAQRHERQAESQPSEAPALTTAEETGEPDIRAWLAAQRQEPQPGARPLASDRPATSAEKVTGAFKSPGEVPVDDKSAGPEQPTVILAERELPVADPRAIAPAAPAAAQSGVEQAEPIPTEVSEPDPESVEAELAPAVDSEPDFRQPESIPQRPEGGVAEPRVELGPVSPWPKPEVVQLAFMPATENGDMAESEAGRLAPASEREPLLVEPLPASEREPVVVEPLPASEREPVVVEPLPASERELVLVEPLPDGKQEPVLVEPLPASKREPVVVEPLPASEREPDVAEPLPASERGPVVVEPLPASEGESVLVEPLPASERESVLVEPLPASEREPVVAEPLPASTREPLVEDPLPASERESALVEPLPTRDREPALVEQLPPGTEAQTRGYSTQGPTAVPTRERDDPESQLVPAETKEDVPASKEGEQTEARGAELDLLAPVVGPLDSEGSTAGPEINTDDDIDWLEPETPFSDPSDLDQDEALEPGASRGTGTGRERVRSARDLDAEPFESPAPDVGDRWLWVDPRQESGYDAGTFDRAAFLSRAVDLFRSKTWTGGRKPERLAAHPSEVAGSFKALAESLGLEVVSDPRVTAGTYRLGTVLDEEKQPKAQST